ncbi:MAG: exodeoxyribonuclease III [Chitinophagaceae bacterium]
MRIISYNVNGIRSAVKKGFCEWLQTDPADIICVQETKAEKDNVAHQKFVDMGFTDYWYSAQKKGYSGVAVFTKIKPDFVQLGNGNMQSDAEGRVIRLDFGDLTLINAYFPSGTTGDIRQQYKYLWLNELLDYLLVLRKERPKLIVCGDYNIAHKEIDIHDPKGNKKSSGFLPEERAWLDKFFATGFVDSFRQVNQQAHQYSWWSQRFPSVRLNNKGWRIDYINVTDNLKALVKDARILPDVKHSDHCPVYLQLAIT